MALDLDISWNLGSTIHWLCDLYHVLDHLEPQFSHQQNGLIFTSQDYCVDGKECV